MAKKSSSRFAKLGFSAEFLDSLDGGLINDCIRRRVQDVSRVCHPDVNTQPAANAFLKDLTAAGRELAVPAIFFEDYKRSAQSPASKKRALEWEEQKTISHRYERVLRMLLNYMRTYTSIKGVVECEVNFDTSGSKSVKAISLFQPVPCSLLMEDILPEVITQTIQRRQKVRDDLNKTRYFELRIGGAAGQGQIYKLEGVPFNIKKDTLPPGVPRSWVRPIFKTLRESCVYLKRTAAPPVALPDRLIGSINMHPDIQDMVAMRFWYQPLLGKYLDHESYALAQNGFPLDRFATLIPYMLPVAVSGLPLIALSTKADEPLLRVLGEIVSMHSLRRPDS